MSLLDAEALIGRPREHLEFSIWFLTQKKLVQRGDNTAIAITVDGVEYLENHFDDMSKNRLLRAKND
jgi:hypothetical protein